MNKQTIRWIDLGREPRVAPDPAYPEGIDLDISQGNISCIVPLPYPAKRCGAYMIDCECGMSVRITTAGRPDDPRSIKIPCKLQ